MVTGLLVVAGIACISLGLLFGLLWANPTEPPLSTADPAGSSSTRVDVVGLVLPSSVPTHLAIPSIGVTSPLLSLGRTAEGALEVPAHGSNYNQAGWYRYSPTPGALGPAVIVGHVDSATEGRSVFFKLGGLHGGDRILVTRSDRTVAVFSVDDVRRYEKSEFPTDLVYGNTNHAGLRLITCGGPIDAATGHYRDNIVVWASLIGSTGTPLASGASPTAVPGG